VTEQMLRSEHLAWELANLVTETIQVDNSPRSAMLLRNLPVQWGALEALTYYDQQVYNGGPSPVLLEHRGSLR